MKAYDVAGKRGGLGVTQEELAQAMEWNVQTLRDVERGKVDISLEQYQSLQTCLNELSGKELVTA